MVQQGNRDGHDGACYKTKEKNTFRLLGVKHQLIRVFHEEAIRQNRAELQNYLEPQQLALLEAGDGKLVHSVRMLSKERSYFIVVKLDIKNAFS